MSQFRTFEDMQVWQESRILIRQIRTICRRELVRKDYAFIDQITRAVSSIAANIAEGSDALTPVEFIMYLGHAKRSASEVRSHLYDAFDEQYVTQQEFDDLQNHAKKIQAMLAKLIHHLQSLNPRLKRTYSRTHGPSSPPAPDERINE